MSANVQNYSNEAIWNFLRASVDSLVFSIAIRNRPESALLFLYPSFLACPLRRVIGSFYNFPSISLCCPDRREQKVLKAIRGKKRE